MSPEDLDAETDRAFEQAEAGDSAGATEICRRVLGRHPRHFMALYLLGSLYAGAGRGAEAISLLQQAISVEPARLTPYLNLATVLFQGRRPQEALDTIDPYLAKVPDDAEAHMLRGSICFDLGLHEEALASGDRAIALQPDWAEAHFNRSNPLRALGRFEESIAACDRAIALRPDYPEAYSNRGMALAEMDRLPEAMASYDKALSLRPNYPRAYFNRALAHLRLGHMADALPDLADAIALKPDYADAHALRASALYNLQRHGEAIADCDRAIALDPANAQAYRTRGNAYVATKRPDLASADYTKSLSLKPDQDTLPGEQLVLRLQQCEWQGYDDALAAITRGIEADRELAPPFLSLVLFGSAQLQQKAARIAARSHAPLPAPAWPARGHRERIRIGYFSADYRNHAVAQLIAGLISAHDRARFETIAFALTPDDGGYDRQRLGGLFDRFLDVHLMSDEEIAAHSRELEVDIAVDLTGYTQGGRPQIFAHHAAPVQVNYLGYPGTMATGSIDYIIADPVLISDANLDAFAEKVAYLPHCYQPNDMGRQISSRPFTRAGLGLPPRGFVFCCFNNSYKIAPFRFALWMRLLGAVEGSVLWLLEDNPGATHNLKREAQRHGIDAARLVFAPRMAPSDHWARHRLADLFLDTFPYTAHTTCSDALWAGLPVLTELGETFASRVAGSILTAAGLPELVTASAAEYEALAVALAREPHRLAAIRRKLEANRLTAPLFDIKRYARDLEALYVEMVRRHDAGLPPDHIHVGS